MNMKELFDNAVAAHVKLIEITQERKEFDFQTATEAEREQMHERYNIAELVARNTAYNYFMSEAQARIGG